MNLYDEIACQYDQITDASHRVAAADAFAKELVKRTGIRSAIDVACGTGLYTIPLARLGLRTVGADISAPMIQQAIDHSRQAEVNVHWVVTPMQDLPGHVGGHFDAILCMGNSIPHLLSDADLDSAIGSFVKVLYDPGIIVLQLLNYARVLASQERIVGINREGDKQYVRFYDFMEGQIRFNILEISWQGEQCTHELHSTLLRPYTWWTLQEALGRHGCRKVDVYSGLNFGAFDEDASDTVLIVGRT